jgi:spoIIIJ-associated protein
MERRDRGGRNWRGGRQERRDRPADEPVRPEGRLVSSEPVTIGPELETFLKIMFVFIGEDAEISVKEDAETATAGVTVQPDSIFSSREGHTIESLKTILDKMINKGPIIRKRVRLQVSEAAQKPDGEMAELGLELGRKALSIGKPVSVRGLPPQDRKAIHSALVNDGRLKTQSSGEGVFRRLYVVPKGARQEPRRPSRDDGLGEKGGNGGGSGRA